MWCQKSREKASNNNNEVLRNRTVSVNGTNGTAIDLEIPNVSAAE
jgi:hypothetical protein